MESGTYDFIGWVEGRTARGSLYPSRVRVYAPEGTWRHATYESDFVSGPAAFHGVWRRVSPMTPEEMEFHTRLHVRRAADVLAAYRKEHPWTRQVDLYTLVSLQAVPGGDVTGSVIAALVEAEILRTHSGSGWLLCDSDVLQHATTWATNKYGVAP